MEQNIEQLKQYYAGLPDHELLHRITQNAQGLRPEAIQVIKEEAKRRGYNLNTEKSLKAQNSPVTNGQVRHYAEIIQSLPCPICNSQMQKTNAVTTKEVVSLIFFSTRREDLVFGCRTCIVNKLKKASAKTRLFGWWALWRGPFITAETLNFNADMRKRITKSQKPTVSLKRYIATNIGLLDSVNYNNSKIFQLMKSSNQANGITAV